MQIQNVELTPFIASRSSLSCRTQSIAILSTILEADEIIINIIKNILAHTCELAIVSPSDYYEFKPEWDYPHSVSTGNEEPVDGKTKENWISFKYTSADFGKNRKMFRLAIVALTMTSALSTRMRGAESTAELEAEGQGKKSLAKFTHPIHRSGYYDDYYDVRKSKQVAPYYEIPIREDRSAFSPPHPQPVNNPTPVIKPHPHHPYITPGMYFGAREYILPPAELVIPVSASIAAIPGHQHHHHPPFLHPSKPNTPISSSTPTDSSEPAEENEDRVTITLSQEEELAAAIMNLLAQIPQSLYGNPQMYTPEMQSVLQQYHQWMWSAAQPQIPPFQSSAPATISLSSSPLVTP
eukprot:Gregarina_sp_Poly_1__2081@NODE_154_length_12409_cov_137_944904_g136_i0_p6_GENE_NODE_154_length_12409_cov_137_944904_g136_i0NODE_154_length_12409_cov_137_944904_g136_i0_p6_ORF_typecomplete_len352_score31_94_NODE_154_length_12409_cov_137_944904_g136_i058846939